MHAASRKSLCLCACVLLVVILGLHASSYRPAAEAHLFEAPRSSDNGGAVYPTRSNSQVEDSSSFLELPQTEGEPCGDRWHLPAPKVHFQQVESHVGPVSLTELHDVMSRLTNALRRDPLLRRVPEAGNATLRLVFFAVDGTLLNLLRWGRIVNDNDIDLAFYWVRVPDDVVDDADVSPARRRRSEASSLLATTADGQPPKRWAYVWLQRWLFQHPSLMGRRLLPRDEVKLHHSFKAVKPASCKHRGGGGASQSMMQCRLGSTAASVAPTVSVVKRAEGSGPVLIDWFGPETVFSELTHFTLESDIEPVVGCSAPFPPFRFPCPKAYEKVLRKFTLNFAGPASAPKAHFEFSGCALFPRRLSERDALHCSTIVAAAVALQKCGLPNLLSQLQSEAECRGIFSK